MTPPFSITQPLIFVSGKGGVGKTTVSMALSLALARSKKKVLLAEIQSQEQVAHLFGRDPIGHEETLLSPRLKAINIDPRQALKEYVLLQLKSRTLYHAVFENSLSRSFLDAAPGLSELMSMGKVYSLLEHYDHVIVDAPATGHGISLLQIPFIVASAVRVGPLKDHCQNLSELLKNPHRTALIVVTLPEELPVREALDMRDWVEKELRVPLAGVVLNQTLPPLPKFSRTEDEILLPLWQAAEDYTNRSERAAEHVRELKKDLGTTPCLEIPYLYSESFGLHEVKEISQSFL